MSDEAAKAERRRAARVVPPEPVTVTMENGNGVAYGIVANISETGACVRTDVAFTPGEELLVRLNFAREAQPVSATGRVVWASGAPKEGNGGLRHGVQWTYDGPHRVRLRLLVKSMIG
jgi:Tfp pilus assembly protein PilZ